MFKFRTTNVLKTSPDKSSDVITRNAIRWRIETPLVIQTGYKF